MERFRVYSVAVSTGGFQSLSASSNLARLMLTCGVNNNSSL